MEKLRLTTVVPVLRLFETLKLNLAKRSGSKLTAQLQASAQVSGGTKYMFIMGDVPAPNQMLFTQHWQTSMAECVAAKATTTILVPAPGPKTHSHPGGQPKRRFCNVLDCNRLVKSQGVCQRHGAATKKCKVSGCIKQAQGSFLSMCSK